MMHDQYVDVTTGSVPLPAATRILRPKSEGPWSFTLNYPRPPKGLHANDRTVWQARMGAIADIRMEVMQRTRNLHIGVLEFCTVQVVWVVGDKRKRDLDNLWPFLKAIYDGIGSSSKGFSAHIVEDDDPAHMDKPGALIRYEKGVKPFFEVTITAGRPDERNS